MRYGTTLPITAFADPLQVKAYAEALENAGFDYIATAGHVMAQPAGSNPQRPNRQYAGPFYDPFVTFAWLAASTRRLRFMSSILILPSLPTVLVARQVAELAIFTGGRFDFGIGISWNPAEYQALGQNFHDRGRRMEEQIEVLRLLWTQPYVSFDGIWHKLESVGLNRGTLPRIPLWFGTETGETALRRVARLADGWMSLGDPEEGLPRLRQMMREAGRDPAQLLVRSPLMAGEGGKPAWVAAGRRLQDMGVTHINLTAPFDLAPMQGLERIIDAHGALSEALE